jgi:hypothetical protein
LGSKLSLLENLDSSKEKFFSSKEREAFQ